MKFLIPPEHFKNDTVYRMLGTDSNSGIFGCGFLNKKKQFCNESDVVFHHYAVVVLLNGDGVYVDSEGSETKLYPGCLIQRIPGRHHSLYIKPDDTWLEFFICIGSDLFKALSGMNILTDNQEILYPGISHALLEKFDEFLHSMKNKNDTELFMLLPEALKIIFMLYEMHSENTGSSEDKEIVRQACLMLSHNPSARTSVHDVSKALGIGYEKFRKMFKAQMGIPPGNYLIQKRMDLARGFLVESSKSIKEISLELGFTDAYTFSKQFKGIVGMSPSDFRKTY
jgi:AraC family transcriptional regulator of arabinose operon